MITHSSYSFTKFHADIEGKVSKKRQVRAIYGALTPLQSLTRIKAGLAPENLLVPTHSILSGSHCMRLGLMIQMTSSSGSSTAELSVL